MQKLFNNSFMLFMKRALPYVKPYWARALVLLLVTIPVGALDSIPVLAIRYLTDDVLVKRNVIVALLVPIGIIGFALIQAALTYTSTYLDGWVGRKIMNDIKFDLYNKLLKFEPGYFDKNLSGNIISRFNGDPEIASAGLLGNIRGMITRSFSTISLVCVLVYNSWQLAIIAIIVLLSTIIPLNKIRKRVKYISDGMMKTGGDIMTHFNETFAGNRIIASYSLANYSSEKFKKSLQEFFRFYIKIIQLNGWVTPFMHVIASIGVAIVISYGSYLVMHGTITTGAFFSFIASLLLLYTPVKSLGNLAIQFQQSIVAMERVFELLDYVPKIQSKENAVYLDTVKNGIKFENVWFEYEKGKPILKDINLDVKMGETIAFVGNSGGGKSTVVNLIPRFYDVLEGRITLDGIDIRDIQLESLRDRISIVFQDNFLFEGTIRENILLGKFDATDAELQQAVKSAFLDEFIASLDRGLDTMIGERGVLLSGGQKQRVAIARALLKNAPIVILDEATSALDNKSEAVVQKAIDKLMENRTVFVIAHRLSTVQNATRIVVIDDGRIVEIGNHRELLNIENGIYRNLYYTQFQQKQEFESKTITA